MDEIMVKRLRYSQGEWIVQEFKEPEDLEQLEINLMHHDEKSLVTDSKKWALKQLEKRHTKEEQAELDFKKAQETAAWLKDREEKAPTLEDLPEDERIRRFVGVPENIEPK